MKKVILYVTPLAILLVFMIFSINNNNNYVYERTLCDSCLSKTQSDASKEGNLKVLSTINVEEAMKNPILIDQHDPRLIKVIRDKYLLPPSNDSIERAYEKNTDPSSKQIATKKVLKLLQNKKGGFFFESGAYDGYHGSNTYYMEKFLGWSGLVVEAGRTLFESVKQNRTGAWKSNTCLSPYSYPVEVIFHESSAQGGIKIEDKWRKRTLTISSPVQCVPLYSLLLAVNQTEVDFLSLDIQGSEMGVLKSIPWNLVQIKTLLIEHNEIADGKEAMLRLMTKKGYKLYMQTNMDYLFYHPNYVTPPDADD